MWRFSQVVGLLCLVVAATTSAWVSTPSITSFPQQRTLVPWSVPRQLARLSTGETSNKRKGYDLGLGKNRPLGSSHNETLGKKKKLQWLVTGLNPVVTPMAPKPNGNDDIGKVVGYSTDQSGSQLSANEQDSQLPKSYQAPDRPDSPSDGDMETITEDKSVILTNRALKQDVEYGVPPPELLYPDIDLSIPESIYSETKDVVWDLMRYEAAQECHREPLLVSFLHSSILNHNSLESSLAFLLANRLSSPAMISTQIQSLILEALLEQDPTIGRSLRADIMAVRDRDPACMSLPDVFLYFKGFHALQTYRVAHVLWNSGKRVLAHFLQSQMSQIFQIDIHPNATLGSGIMLDHGTGIVIGETATVGHNCSILHHVTLGGSGKKGVDRHPKIGEGVLLGAGASVLGNVRIGDGCQVGAGTLLITDLPSHSVAVGVPAKIIGSFVDGTEQPSIGMNQMMDKKIVTFELDGI